MIGADIDDRSDVKAALCQSLQAKLHVGCIGVEMGEAEEFFVVEIESEVKMALLTLLGRTAFSAFWIISFTAAPCRLPLKTNSRR